MGSVRFKRQPEVFEGHPKGSKSQLEGSNGQLEGLGPAREVSKVAIGV